jgi:transcriptional antiterminator NusG
MSIEVEQMASTTSFTLSEANADRRWYAVQTRSHFEHRVAAALQARLMTTYLPVLSEIHQWSDRERRIEVPVFPCYLFVQLSNVAAARLPILETSGTVRIVGSRREPEPVADREINALRRVLSSGRSCLSVPYIEQGATVRIVRGPLKNLDGVFVRDKGKGRFLISVELLGQSVATEVSADEVQVISRLGTAAKDAGCETKVGACLSQC